MVWELSISADVLQIHGGEETDNFDSIATSP